MIRKTLKEIHEMAEGINDISAFHDVEIQGVCIDSRKIEPLNLFIPLIGEHVDGHQYVEKAISAGAGAALWCKSIPNPPENLPIIVVEDPLQALQSIARRYREQSALKVVGITGSNGKTTTKDMTAALLGTTFKVHKTKGNYNNHIGLPLTLLSMDLDTEVAILEMGMSSRGEIEFLSQLAKPDIAIITNIGESHLLDLGSREEIAKAKLEIISGLSPNGTLIYHGDEPLLKDRITLALPEFEILSFGRDEQNDVFPRAIESGKGSTTFYINDVQYTIPVLGNHNVLNALAAILAARTLGVTEQAIKDGLGAIKLTNMRMELVKGLKGESIINDAYNASPTSVKAAVELIEELPGFNHKYLVLGDMLELGPQEKDFHLKIGELINPDKITKIFTYGVLGDYIAKGAAAVFPSDRIFAFQDKTLLVEELKKTIETNDLILVKASRGMKLEEVVQSLQGSKVN